MSVPHIRARSSKNALTPEDGRRNDRPKRRASVNRLEVDVNRPTDFNTNDLSPPQSGFRKSVNTFIWGFRFFGLTQTNSSLVLPLVATYFRIH